MRTTRSKGSKESEATGDDEPATAKQPQTTAVKRLKHVPCRADRLSQHSWTTEDVIQLVVDHRVKHMRLDTGRPVSFEPAGSNRVTAIAWNPRHPHECLIGSKWGNLALLDQEFTDHIPVGRPLATTYKEVDIGSGPGGSVTAIRYDPIDTNIVYTTSITGAVTRRDLNSSGGHHDTGDVILECSSNPHKWWYTAVDYSPTHRLVLAGSSTGGLVKINLDESRTPTSGTGSRRVLWKGSKRAHRGKITHIEFHPSDPNLYVTAGGDNCVRLWDLRRWSDTRDDQSRSTYSEPLLELRHNHGVNSAKFNPSGRRLLTTDQRSEVRVYSSGSWSLERSIDQPHRQFQHLTPICAVWHPLTDLIAVGRYPLPVAADTAAAATVKTAATVETTGTTTETATKSAPTSITPITAAEIKSLASRRYWRETCGIDFFSAQTGERVHHLQTDLIPSLVEWNATGDTMAVGVNSNAFLARVPIDRLIDRPRSGPGSGPGPGCGSGTDSDSDSDTDRQPKKKTKRHPQPASRAKRSDYIKKKKRSS